MADDTITLVTSDEPPVELVVERAKLLDSRVFSDMLSLPGTNGSQPRVDVAETAADLEAWIQFMRSGELKPAESDLDGAELGRMAVSIARLVDKYACSNRRHRLVDELWRVLVERSAHPLLIVFASDVIGAENLKRHAAADTLSLHARCREDSDFFKGDQILEREALEGWNRRFTEVDKTWSSILMSVGRDENLIDGFDRAVKRRTEILKSFSPPHVYDMLQGARQRDLELRRNLPPFPA